MLSKASLRRGYALFETHTPGAIDSMALSEWPHIGMRLDHLMVNGEWDQE